MVRTALLAIGHPEAQSDEQAGDSSHALGASGRALLPRVVARLDQVGFHSLAFLPSSRRAAS